MQTSAHADSCRDGLHAINSSSPEGKPGKSRGRKATGLTAFRPMTAGLPAKAFAFVVIDFLS